MKENQANQNGEIGDGDLFVLNWFKHRKSKPNVVYSRTIPQIKTICSQLEFRNKESFSVKKSGDFWN